MNNKSLMSVILGMIGSSIFILITVNELKYINDNIHTIHGEALFIPGICLIAVILLWQLNKFLAMGVLAGSLITFSLGFYWLSQKYPVEDVRDDIGNQFSDININSVK